MKNFKSIKKPILSKEVEKQLRKSINAGAFKPGDKLPSERELVDQFQVSRVTIRDALKNLQSFGLISIRRGLHAGAYVSEPTPQPITQSFENLIQMGKVNFANLIETRLYFEPNLSRSAALLHTREDIENLCRLLDRAEEKLSKSRKEARLINVRFHCEVAKITRNYVNLFICDSITQVFSALIIEMTQKRLDKEAIRKLISEHREIKNAIASGDPLTAFEMTKKHLLETYYTYSKIMPEGYDEKTDRHIKSIAGL